MVRHVIILCLIDYFNVSRWIVSQAKKEGVDISLSKYDGVWSVEVPESASLIGDYSLVLKSKARHHAVSSKLRKPFKFDAPNLVIQYEVRFQEGIECGGAYIKLLTDSKDLDLVRFHIIMFCVLLS